MESKPDEEQFPPLTTVAAPGMSQMRKPYFKFSVFSTPLVLATVFASLLTLTAKTTYEIRKNAWDCCHETITRFPTTKMMIYLSNKLITTDKFSCCRSLPVIIIIIYIIYISPFLKASKRALHAIKSLNK